MAEEEGLTVDHEGFGRAMEEQRARARASSKQKRSSLAGDVYTEVENEKGGTAFVGYEVCAGTGRVLALLTAEGRVERVEGPAEIWPVKMPWPFPPDTVSCCSCATCFPSTC